MAPSEMWVMASSAAMTRILLACLTERYVDDAFALGRAAMGHPDGEHDEVNGVLCTYVHDHRGSWVWPTVHRVVVDDSSDGWRHLTGTRKKRARYLPTGISCSALW